MTDTERLRLRDCDWDTKTERLRLRDRETETEKQSPREKDWETEKPRRMLVHSLRHINISIFKQQRLIYIRPFLKTYQHFDFQTPEADINLSISLCISTFQFSNIRGWLELVHFLTLIRQGAKWPTANLNNYFYVTGCPIDLKQSCIFKFVPCLEVYKKNVQFGPWRDHGGPLIIKGPPISASQGQF